MKRSIWHYLHLYFAIHVPLDVGICLGSLWNVAHVVHAFEFAWFFLQHRQKWSIERTTKSSELSIKAFVRPIKSSIWPFIKCVSVVVGVGSMRMHLGFHPRHSIFNPVVRGFFWRQPRSRDTLVRHWKRTKSPKLGMKTLEFKWLTGLVTLVQSSYTG